MQPAYQLRRAGKTAVLVRIIRKITDHENPVDIDKLLMSPLQMRQLRNEGTNRDSIVKNWTATPIRAG